MKHALCAALIVLASGVYLPGLPGGFLFDDFVNIVENPAFKDDSPGARELLAMSFSGHAGPTKRPLSMFSFAVNYRLAGHSPFAYKLTNVLIHLVNGLLVYAMVWLLVTHAPAVRRASAARFTRWLPLASALVWTVHPVNLTSVLYVVQRMNSLAALFTLLGICVYLRWRARLLARDAGFAVPVIGILACGALATLSKENGVLLFVMLFVIEVCLFGFRSHARRGRRSLIVFFAAMLLLPALAGLVLLGMFGDGLLAGYAIRPFDLSQRLLTESRVMWLYLGMLCSPSLSLFGLFHDDLQISTGLFSPPTTALSILGLAVLLLVALSAIRRQGVLAFGLLWFFAAQLMESTVLPLELVHEHRNYLASIGPVFAACYYLREFSARARAPALFPVGVVVVCLSFSLVTVLRARTWSSPLRLALAQIEHHPASARAHYNLASNYVLLNVKAGDRELLDRARRQLELATELDAYNQQALFGQIQVAFLQGRRPDPGMLARLNERLRSETYNPSTANSLERLVNCHVSRECELHPAEMMALFGSLLENPTLNEKRKKPILTQLARYYLHVLRDADSAALIIEEILRHSPGDIEQRLNLIKVLSAGGRYREAASRIEETREELSSCCWLAPRNYAAELDELQASLERAGASPR